MPTKLWEKGKSANPKGKPKGAVNLCTKVKNDYFRVYEELGGFKFFKKYLGENRRLWPEFFLKVLPHLMPKNVTLDGSIDTDLHFHFHLTEKKEKGLKVDID